ncbi:hypothetical protein DFH08DRAFT_965527 [Mycena albidolilacea]|uniref:Uncharacterized protein n=1 Tax=Mycena albidolilacea TaxID=1033008 RepID=A0AAD7EME1_9AGAR|nr:hypothetical protein DFH08DRAFT_965527 [Mycena albidolilacea]
MFHNIPAFRHFLQSPYCTFAPHVRTVSFSGYHQETNKMLLAEALRRLTQVRALEIFMNLERAYLFLAIAFPNVTKLHLCSYGKLHMLSYGTCPPSTTLPPRELRSVKLMGNVTTPILAWLHATERLLSVDSVQLQHLRGDTIPLVRAALHQSGSALRHLDIGLDLPFVDPDDTYPVQSTLFHPRSSHLAWLDLSPHPELRTLAICDFSQGLSGDFSPGQVLPLVKALAAPKLEQPELDLNPTLYSPTDWAALDALLSSFLCRLLPWHGGLFVLTVLWHTAQDKDVCDGHARHLDLEGLTSTMCRIFEAGLYERA